MSRTRQQRSPEKPPEDFGPPREPWGQWLADTMEEIKEEARRHFPETILAQVSEYCVSSTGSEEKACMKFITIVNRALFIHLPTCPSYAAARAGTAHPTEAAPRPTKRDIQRGRY
uniref:Vpr protein n=1 Tax=Simian immunodeficiency virus TaxID=11723 RepID=Q9Q0A0_SIV|nr:Vpr protein [Simian immunodeficiency virus]